jgi:hypothetical protein
VEVRVHADWLFRLVEAGLITPSGGWNTDAVDVLGLRVVVDSSIPPDEVRLVGSRGTLILCGVTGVANA